MKKFKVEIFKDIMDDEVIRTFYVLCETKDDANEIRYAFCKTFGCVGCVTEVSE